MKDLIFSSRLARFLLAAFVVSLVVTAFLAYTSVRDLVLTWQITGLEGSPFSPAEGEGQPRGADGEVTLPGLDPDAPLQPAGPAPAPWDGASRVTVLLMGLDYRDWEAGNGPPRTDTMMLLTIDPLSNTAGMLSIPRDLWVPIPGFENGKINTAYQLGEAYNLPGGGAALAMQTVEQLLGVPIDFYAQVDFNAFVRIIDEIGGVKLNIPEEITVDPLGDKPPKTLKPGVTVLPGDLALAYARARNTEGGDFDRAQRQQQVILAIRDRVLSFDLIPVLIAKAPVLYAEIAGGVRTNMTLDQVIRLGLLAQQIPEENIKRGVINGEYVTFGLSPDGLDILKPIPDKIRLLRDEVFSTASTLGPAAVDKSPQELVAEEAARISLLNGTLTAGLAAETKEFLESRGLTVTVVDNADQQYRDTTIIDYTGNPYTLRFLVDLMEIKPARVFHSYNPDSSIDIEITLGDDWVNNGVLP